MRNFSCLCVIFVSFCGIVHADNSCSSSNAITVESLSASASGPGGVSNSVVITLGNGLTKAGIQNLKRKRDDGGGGKGGGKGGNGGGNNGGNGGGGDNGGSSSLDCSNTGSGLETCYSVQSVPFCYNYATGSFHAAKISGNASNGNYTLVTGQTGNLYTGPYPTPTGTVTGSGRGTSTGDHGGNGGGGSDDSRTPRTTASSTGNATAVITNGVSTTTSGVSTTSSGVFTTTLPATASTNPTGTQTSASVSSTLQAGAAGHLASPNFGLLGAVVGILLI